MVSELLRDFPVVIEVPIAWGEMDAFQHVNNIVYFRQFESARVAYFERIGYLEFMRKTGLGPILASAECRFKAPLTYPDTVSVGARVPTMEVDRFVMEYITVSHERQTLAAEGQGLVVSYDYKNLRKAPLPAEIKKRIAQLEGHE